MKVEVMIIKINVDFMRGYKIDIEDGYKLGIYYNVTGWFTKVQLELYKDNKFIKNDCKKFFNREKIGFSDRKTAINITKKVNKFSQEFAGVDVVDGKWVRREFS